MNKKVEAIHTFLANNLVDVTNLGAYNNKFTVFYYVGESRKFAEETRVAFDFGNTDTITIMLNEINFIEFETNFSTNDYDFSYDEEGERLYIVGNNSDKHDGEYKIVVNSNYFDMM